jgi:hypothetical protein
MEATEKEEEEEEEEEERGAKMERGNYGTNEKHVIPGARKSTISSEGS